LYLARAISMLWLGGLATMYLHMLGESIEEHHKKNPLDFLRAIFQSYTQNKIVRRHVHEWEGRFELFVENSQDVILLLGKDGCILDGNKTAIKYLGLDVEELQKIYFHNLTITEAEGVPEYIEAVGKESIHWTSAWKKLIDEEKHTIQEEWLVKDHKQRYISLECSINLLELGNEKFALVTGRNSTSRHKLNVEKQNLRLQLNHSQRLESVGRLAGGIAHDFNNLLHSIQGSLDAIERQPDPERQEALHSNISHAVARASVLTGQLLGFARKGKYEVKKVDLSSIMNTTHSLFQPIARKTVKCRLILHPEPLFAKADANQLEQVFLNLLINSRDALEHGDNPKIFFRLEPASDYTPGWEQAPNGARPNEYACIRCRDNGEGISEENLKTIFDPFFTTKSVGKGTGMGLAMAYGTIQNHNGWIHVESEIGKGTEFFIFIPLYHYKSDKSFTQTQLNISI
ncbi:MAG: PAS domain S-box protein, partial [Lentisphaeraceae bacterium]|nr:PAS domain S-box protein [Lentisphaeraceae bacterium]